ncbi:MAG: putative addiction module antidote protein, partial [Acinetobacter sp.]
AEHLKTEEDMQAYLQACIDESNGDAAFIAKAKGMAQLSRDTGLGRESLYKALSGDVNPSFDTVIKVVKALNLRLAI